MATVAANTQDPGASASARLQERIAVHGMTPVRPFGVIVLRGEADDAEG